jgi:hypothetical protein
MKRLLLLLPILLLVFAGAVVAGCGGSSTLDTAEVERELEDLAEEEDIEVEDVTCPDDVEAKEGDTFDCDIETRDGVEIEAEVEQRNDDGDVRVRIAASEIQKAQAGGESTDTGTETTPTEPDTDTGGDGGGGEANPQDAQLVESAIRSLITAYRAGDAETWCGQQTDGRLARKFGGIRQCIASDEATTAAPSLPDGDDVEVEITGIDGNRAAAEVTEPDGDSVTYTLVDEGGQGGWAIDTSDGE